MKSKRYFEYDLKRDRGLSTKNSLGWSIQVHDINKANLYTDQDSDYTQEEEHPISEATSDFGWITPYEWFAKKDSTEVDIKDKSIHNGNLGIEARGDDKFKGKVWWCEDLRNWCVYATDCVNDPYVNKFELRVWNGRDGFEPIRAFNVNEEDKDKEWKQWKPWQNAIMGNIVADCKTIIHHRGSNGPTLQYGPGPLTLNEAFVLQSTDKFSVNSANDGFKTKRESRIRHIEDFGEFKAFDKLAKINVAGSTRYVLVKFRNSFIQNNRGNSTFDSWQTGNPFIQKHCMDCVDTTTERSNTWDNYRIEGGKIVWKEINHAKGFYDWKNELYYKDNNIDYKSKSACASDGGIDDRKTWKINNQPAYTWNRSSLSNEELGSYAENEWNNSAPVSPYDIRMYTNNHICLSEVSSEKIFAVYFYDDTGALCYQPMPGDDADKMKTVLHGTELTTYPVYMSYIDIEFLFYNLETLRKTYSLHIPKCTYASGKNGVWDFTEKRWAGANRRMLQKVAYALFNDKMWSEQAFPDKGVVQNWQLVNDDVTVGQTVYDNLNKLVDSRIIGGCAISDQTAMLITVYQSGDNKIGIWGIQSLLSKYGLNTKNTAESMVGRAMMESTFEALGHWHAEVAREWWDEPVWAMPLTYGYMACAEVALAVVDVIATVGGLVVSAVTSVIYAIAGWSAPVPKNQIALPESYTEQFEFSKVEGTNTFNIDSTSRSGSTDYTLSVHKGYVKAFLDSIGDDVDTVISNYQLTTKVSLYNCGFVGLYFGRKEISNPAVSYYREGVSIGNPAVWRLPTGEIALSTILWWGGKNGLIGGPPDSDNDYESCQSNADKQINGYCQEWFGEGTDKTIDDDWLKPPKHEMDEDSESSGIIVNGYLESGYVFEQINKECNETLSLKLSTRRPLVYTDINIENADIAKKW